MTRVFRSIAPLAMIVLLALPAQAQFDDEDDDMDFGPLTSAEQEVIFDSGIAAYDAGDYALAFETWLPIAQTGNMAAQRNVAHMLRQGLGVEQDLTRAAYFYRRAAETGLVNAMINLASMLLKGEGMTGPNEREAARWFYEASLAGDPRAQYALGVMAARGMGIERNPDAAIELFRRAAAQGLRDAQLRLVEAGLPLVEQVQPGQMQFNLPRELEPLPGESLAADLMPTVAPVTEPGAEPDLRTAPSPSEAEAR